MHAREKNHHIKMHIAGEEISSEVCSRELRLFKRLYTSFSLLCPYPWTKFQNVCSFFPAYEYDLSCTAKFTSLLHSTLIPTDQSPQARLIKHPVRDASMNTVPNNNGNWCQQKYANTRNVIYFISPVPVMHITLLSERGCNLFLTRPLMLPVN